MAAPEHGPELERNRASYRHGDALEQYVVNGPLGLEHGFLLDERPAGDDGPIVLELSIAEGLVAVMDEVHSGVSFYTPDGGVALRYTDLYAHDATGEPLTAWMRAEGEAIRLFVDDTGGSYPVTIDPLLWNEQGKLVAGDGVGLEEFGSAVSVDGDTALVGAFQDDDGGNNSGSAYVFVRSAGTWTEQQKLLPSDGAPDDFFGCGVSLDDDTALVGAFYDDDSGDNSGSAYVFVRSAGTWMEQAKLTATDGAAGDLFASQYHSPATRRWWEPWVTATAARSRDPPTFSCEPALRGHSKTSSSRWMRNRRITLAARSPSLTTPPW